MRNQRYVKHGKCIMISANVFDVGEFVDKIYKNLDINRRDLMLRQHEDVVVLVEDLVRDVIGFAVDEVVEDYEEEIRAALKDKIEIEIDFI